MRAGYGPAWVAFKTGRGSTEVQLAPGQFIFGRKAAAAELRMKPSTVWKRMQKLKTMQNIDIQSSSHCSIVSIVNWPAYQPPEVKRNTSSNNQVTGKEQASNRQGTQTRIDKNTKKTKKKKKPCANPPDLRLAGKEIDFYWTKKNRRLSGKRLETFNRFWAAWDYKKDKAKAADAWLDIAQLTDSLVETIVAAAEAEAHRRPELVAKGRTPQYAEGWLHGRRWEDETDEESEDAKYEAAFKRAGL
jgi:hypothetical protein